MTEASEAEPALALPPELDATLHPPDDAMLRLLPLRDGASLALPHGLTYVFVVYTHRSGSTFLAELLASTGFFNQAAEMLNPEAAVLACNRHGWGSISQYFLATAQRDARGGHYVAKVTIAQLALLASHGLLRRILADSRFLVVERMDKLAQAISWSIANQTGEFTSRDRAGPSPAVPTYDGAALRRDLERVVEQHTRIDLFMALNGLAPLHLSYETLIAEPVLSGALVCQFLGQPHLTCDPARIGLERQATALNTAWRDRFLGERQRLVAVQPLPKVAPRTARFRPISLAGLEALALTTANGQPRAVRRAYLPGAAFRLPGLAFGDGETDDSPAGKRIECPPVPAWLLRGVVVHGTQGIVTLDDRVVTESLRDVALDTIGHAARDPDGDLHLPVRREAPQVTQATHLLPGNPESYAAWMLDVLGRLSATALPLAGDAAQTLLLPRLDVFWKWESLGLLLSDAAQRMELGLDQQVAVRRLLYVPDVAAGGLAPHPSLRAMFDAIRRLAIGEPHADWRPTRRLFVARGIGAGSAVANGADLQAHALRAGFQRVVPGELPVIEQARLFAEASHILAPHGADLANLPICHPGARLCELRPAHAADWRIRRLAALREAPYGYLLGTPADAAGAWTLDPERLDALLADPRFAG